MRVQRLATAPVFAEILKVWGAISPVPLVRLASNFGFGAVGSGHFMVFVLCRTGHLCRLFSIIEIILGNYQQV